MKRVTKRACIGTAAAVVASVLIPITQTTAFADEAPFAIPASETLTTPAVYDLTIAGAPVTESLSAAIYALPKSSDLAAMPDETLYEPPVIAWAERTGDGTMTMRVPADIDLSLYDNGDGLVNVNVRVFKGTDYSVVTSMPRVLSISGSASATTNTSGATTTASVGSSAPVTEASTTTIGGGGGGGTTNPTNPTSNNLAPPTTQVLAQAPSNDPSATSTSDPAYVPSDTVSYTYAGNDPAGEATPDAYGVSCPARYRYMEKKITDGTPGIGIIGSSWSNTGRSEATFSWTASAQTTVGVAVGVSLGALTAEGGVQTVAVDESAFDFDPIRGARKIFYNTYFISTKFEIGCYHAPTRKFVKRGFKIQPTAIAGGGAYTTALNASNAKKCVLIQPGVTMTLSSSRSITWSGGITVAGLGVSLKVSSSTGWTSAAKQKYKNFGTANMYGCGRGSYPAAGNPQVFGAAATAAGL